MNASTSHDTLLVIQAVVPDYRIKFFEEISRRRKVRLIAGASYFEPSVRTPSNAYQSLNLTEASNSYLLKRKILLQVWPQWWRDILSQCERVVELNPRCVTSWISLISSMVFRRGQTYLWGHLSARNGGRGFLGARSLMISLADGVIFYTESDTRSFKCSRLGRSKKAWTAPNSVVHADQITSFREIGNDFLYSGRLISGKKPQLLISAFAEFLKSSEAGSTLHIIGDGPLRSSCEGLAKELGITQSVIFHGHISNDLDLSQIYRYCVAAVSPGYGGLAITQSFSFGRPVILARSEPHAPEIEQFKDGFNGEFFESDSVNGLADTLRDFYQSKEKWAFSSREISDAMKTRYTIEVMASGFLSGFSRAI